MTPIDITPLMKKYGPGYVAKDNRTGKVVAHSKRIDLLFKATKDKNVVIGWVPGEKARYVFRIPL